MQYMDQFFKTITWAGSILALFPLALGMATNLVMRGRRNDAMLILGGLMGASILTHVLKRVFARPRPDVEELLVAMPPDFSFPSAHTAQVVAFTLACAIVIGNSAPVAVSLLAWALLGLAAVAVGVSRVWLHVHYVSDVVAGAIIAATWVLALDWMLKSWK